MHLILLSSPIQLSELREKVSVEVESFIGGCCLDARVGHHGVRGGPASVKLDSRTVRSSGERFRTAAATAKSAKQDL